MTGESGFWEDTGAGLRGSAWDLASVQAWWGRAEGRRPHSPALIFDFEERCLQCGHWEGRGSTLAIRLLRCRARGAAHRKC